MPSTESSLERFSLTQAEDALQEVFGLPSFREGQREVISRILDGKSAAAIFPTGGGKSLCYQLPGSLFSGLTLVVSPLLALMREQVQFLRDKGIAAARIDSTLDATEYREVHERVRQGQTKLLYVAPERFFNERFREFIQGCRISLFAIDEAHCISQWGHNFRPDYLKLARIASELKAERVLALTATATPTVLDDIQREFQIDKPDAVQTPFYRSNLELRCSVCDPKRRNALLQQRLESLEGQPAIVYVTLQHTAEQVAETLESQDFQAKAYHAGLKEDERQSIQDWFMREKDAIVVATIAFGMGIDKPDIRAVIHFNPSKSIENYAQEIGRAGRDGEPAICETLLVPEDKVVLENFAYGDTPNLASIRIFVEFLVGQPADFFISHYALSYESDIRISVVRTLLTQLELGGYLEATSPRYEVYRFKPRTSSQEMLKHFEGERRQFASAVISQALKKRDWFHIDLPAAANRIRADRNRIVKMLDYFAEQGWIELSVSGLVHGYRKEKLAQVTPDLVDELSQELYEHSMSREVGELARLNELFELLLSGQCISAGLSAHFGQPLGKAECGHCGVCSGEQSEEMLEPDFPRIGDSALTGVRRLAKEHPEHLKEVRQQARFLCGLSSPRLQRARLTREALYGCCNEIPFEAVMEGLMD